MITELKNKNLFCVKCSEWAVAVESTDHYEACTAAISYMMESYGRDLKLSCVMVSTDINSMSDALDDEDHTMYHATSKILANAGFHHISKTMKKIFDT